MRVVYAIPVRHVDTLQDGTLVAVGIETTGIVTPIPGVVSGSFVLCFAGTHTEAQPGIDHPLEIRILGPDLSEAAPPMQATFQLAPGPGTPAGWEVRVQIPLVATFEALVAGTYSIEIGCGDGLPLSVAIIVIEANPAP
jgi:hypothetical protein